MKNSLILLLLLAVAEVFSQNSATISGRVLDSSNELPVPFCSVALFNNAENSLITGGLTNEDGRFNISTDLHGEFILKISYIGYEEKTQEILLGELNAYYDLGNIRLDPGKIELDELTVRGDLSQTNSALDKKTYDMDSQIANSGGSILDAMKSMPGITIDQEGKVILRGSDKVIILIDGKQSSLTGFGNQKGLDNIPVSSVDKIEIINNPSAKYDASGMAGVINIIYKKELQYGFNGEASFSYGLGALTKAREDLPTQLGSYSTIPKYIPGLNMNYRTEKINISLQPEMMIQNKLPNNEFTTRHYDDGRVTASQVPENRTQKHYIVNGGIDYFINDQNTLTFSGIYDWERHIDTAQVAYINMNTGSRYRYLNWNEEEITGYANYRVNYNHKFPQIGHVLEAYVQYTKGWEDETYNLHDSSSIRQDGDLTSILATEHTLSSSVDYTKPLAFGRFEAGSKFQVRRLPVDFTLQRGENSVIYPGLGEWTNWGENIYAGYVNYLLEKARIDVEAGLRAEYTSVFYEFDPANIYYDENDAYDYFELFPNVRLTWKINKSNRISLFYNRRIDRPGEPELRIFAKSDDQELLKIGNPYLRPQFTSSYEMAYKLKWNKGSIFLAGFYRMIYDPYMRIYSIDTSNVQYDVITKIYANTGSAINSGFEVIFEQQIMDAWKFSGNLDVYQNKVQAYQGNLLFPYPQEFSIESTSETTWDLKINNLFNLTEDLRVQLTAVYFAPRNIPQGRQLARSSIDLGIRYKVLKGKGEISLTASDIFNRFGIRQVISGEGFSVLYENYYETQVISLGGRYKF